MTFFFLCGSNDPCNAGMKTQKEIKREKTQKYRGYPEGIKIFSRSKRENSVRSQHGKINYG